MKLRKHEDSIMKVLYDFQAFTKQKYGGVSRCFMELYRHLPPDVDAELSVIESSNVYLQGIDGIKPNDYTYKHFICERDFPLKRRLHILYDRLTRGGYYPNCNRTYTIEKLREGNFDIFHPTYFEDYFLPYLKGKPFVLTIHDMIPELYPQYFARDDVQIVMKKKLAPLADAIIAVSERTKKDVVEILGIPEEKVHVVYHGCSFLKVIHSQSLFNNLYILYVGERGGYKNFKMFVRYVVPFLKSHTEISVVCTGRPFDQNENELFVKMDIRERFIHYWVETDEDFYSIYHHALCFVYTSEYEGFGIPILEAYQADCPVLLKHASCFPEIAGDAAIYFEMDSGSSDIVDKLEYIYSMNTDEKEALLIKQRQRLELYSWEKSAQRLVGVYRSILANV